jgi:hypothetical protein
MDNETKTRIEARLNATMAVAEAIKSLGQVPSGHLYTRVMEHMSLGVYQSIIELLKKVGMVTEDRSHMLTWKGGR